MGPPPTWKSDHRGRMEAVRSLLRPSPRRPSASNPFSRSNSGGNSACGSGLGEDAPEWAPSTFARVRARPSSLYPPLRSSPTFPLSHRRSSPSVAAPSPDQDLPSRFHTSRQGAIRSQSTHATQTETPKDAEDGGEWSTAIRLGAFGEVADMTLETVNFLIRVLEDRRHELMHDGVDEEAEQSISSHASDHHNHRWTEDPGITSDLHESVQNVPTTERGASSSPRRQLNRTHSYEALVRLEGILESRHQQLMQDGLGDDADDSQDQEESVLPMTDIQDEVKRIYSSLRTEELAAGGRRDN